MMLGEALRFAGLAAVLDATGIVVVHPGVAVRKGEGGRHVAVVYGGHRSRVDRDAVVAAARAALADWPEQIDQLELAVDPDPPRNHYTRRGRRARGLA